MKKRLLCRSPHGQAAMCYGVGVSDTVSSSGQWGKASLDGEDIDLQRDKCPTDS